MISVYKMARDAFHRTLGNYTQMLNEKARDEVLTELFDLVTQTRPFLLNRNAINVDLWYTIRRIGDGEKFLDAVMSMALIFRCHMTFYDPNNGYIDGNDRFMKLLSESFGCRDKKTTLKDSMFVGLQMSSDELYDCMVNEPWLYFILAGILFPDRIGSMINQEYVGGDITSPETNE